MHQDTNTTRGARREDRHPLHDTTRDGRLYWVREPGVRVRSGPGLQHPVLTQLARGRAVTADTDATLAADGYHWLPIRHGDHTAYIARELLAERYVRPDPEGIVAVAPELMAAVQGTPLAAHTRTLMAIALCESGARTARDNGGELVYRFEPRQWDRLFRNTLGDPPATWTPEKCYVTSWGVAQIMGWAHATFGCANARAFRDWLQADPAHEYEALVHFCLAKPGVADAIQAQDWAQLAYLYNGGHPQWLPNFQNAWQRVGEVETPAVPISPPPEPVVPPVMAPEPQPGTFPRHPGPTSPQSSKAAALKQRLRPPATVRPALQGLRYEGNRLLRRALVILSLGFTLWQTQVITPAQIVGLLEEAVVPLVTSQTDPVAGRLDQSLSALEARLATLEQTARTGPGGETKPLTVFPTPTPAADQSPNPVCHPRQTVTSAWYHVRVQPDLTADVVAVLRPGTPVCVLDRQDGWHLLQTPAGWITDQGLKPLPIAG